MPKKIVVFLFAMFVAVIVAGCGNEATNGKESKELIVVDWGGPYTEIHQEVVFKPFEEKYDVKVKVVTPPDVGKLKSMVESGNVEWDVVSVGDDFAIRGGREGLLEKLDFDVIKTDGLPEELVHDYAVPENTFSTVISFNTDTFPVDKHPTTWAEFFDTANFPGDRSLYNDPMWTLEAALLADGVEPENLYPLDVDRAFKKLDEIKSHVKVWWTAGAQPPEILATNQVPLSSSWAGRVIAAKTDGAAVDVDFNQGLILSNSWAVPKGAPNKDLAMKFIAFSLEPEQQAALSNKYDNAPANANAIELLTDESKVRLGLDDSTDLLQKQIYINTNWWVDNYEEVNERFRTWLLE